MYLLLWCGRHQGETLFWTCNLDGIAVKRLCRLYELYSLEKEKEEGFLNEGTIVFCAVFI